MKNVNKINDSVSSVLSRPIVANTGRMFSFGAMPQTVTSELVSTTGHSAISGLNKTFDSIDNSVLEEAVKHGAAIAAGTLTAHVNAARAHYLKLSGIVPTWGAFTTEEALALASALIVSCVEFRERVLELVKGGTKKNERWHVRRNCVAFLEFGTADHALIKILQGLENPGSPETKKLALQQKRADTVQRDLAQLGVQPVATPSGSLATPAVPMPPTAPQKDAKEAEILAYVKSLTGEAEQAFWAGVAAWRDTQPAA